jgi:peptidyl-prolyl cis-trans isomerase SDCCAG10
VTEPITRGKVVLNTTVGPLDVELWPKEAPKTVRNFVQLCMEGYYDGCIFHRIVKDFIVQTGDPTGTGTGGESIYGHPFEDEFHSRLRFTHRGIVAMATTGRNQNRSQFFITLDKTPELDRKHTIFGKITGDSMYNLLKMNDFEVDQNDRPIYPPKILSTEILYNPFDDIVPRVLPSKVVDIKADTSTKETQKGVKKFSLLSFGDEAEEEEEITKKTNVKMISSYYVDFPSERPPELSDTLDNATDRNETKNDKSNDIKNDNINPNAIEKSNDKEPPNASPLRKENESDATNQTHVDNSSELKDEENESSANETVENEEEKLKTEISKLNRKRKERNEMMSRGGLTELEQRRLKFLKNTTKLTKKEREQMVLERLARFEQQLKQPKEGEDWKTHRLRFEEDDSEKNDPMARRTDLYEYAVIDPLKGLSPAEIRKLKEQKVKKKPKENW